MVGDLGFKLHTGRSRNEQIATDLRLFIRRGMDAIRSEMAGLVDAFLGQAEAKARRPCRPIPICSAPNPSWLRIGCWPMRRCSCAMPNASRIAGGGSNILPLGSGAIAGPGIVLDRPALAKELGFDGITANSMDATSDRDFALEYLHDLTLLALHLSRWAEEMALFSTVEFGFVHFPSRIPRAPAPCRKRRIPTRWNCCAAKREECGARATLEPYEGPSARL